MWLAQNLHGSRRKRGKEYLFDEYHPNSQCTEDEAVGVVYVSKAVIFEYLGY